MSDEQPLNFPLSYDTIGDKVVNHLAGILFTSAALFNTLVLIVYIRTPSLWSQSSHLLMAMVFCDWAFGLINGAGIFYVTAVGGFNNAMLCNIQGFFALQLGCGSIITVGSIAVERYWMIVKQKPFTPWQMKGLFLFMFALSTFLGSFPFIFHRYPFEVRGCKFMCAGAYYLHTREGIAYSLMLITLTVSTMTLIAACYVRIYVEVRRKTRELHRNIPISLQAVVATGNGGKTAGLPSFVRSTFVRGASGEPKSAVAMTGTTTSTTVEDTADSRFPQKLTRFLMPSSSANEQRRNSSTDTGGAGSSTGGGDSRGKRSQARAERKRHRLEREILSRSVKLVGMFTALWSIYLYIVSSEVISGRPTSYAVDVIGHYATALNAIGNGILVVVVNQQFRRRFCEALGISLVGSTEASDGGHEKTEGEKRLESMVSTIA